MSNLQIFKELTLPETLQANSMYLVAPVGSDLLSIYVTGTDATVIRRTLNNSDVAALIAQAGAEGSGITSSNRVEVVTTIAERDALVAEATANFVALVTDATADETVVSGAATYVYIANTQQFVKVAEYESMDFKVNWADIVGKPEIEQAQLNNLVRDSHTHTNLEVLEKLSEGVDGKLNYNGTPVSTVSFADPQW